MSDLARHYAEVVFAPLVLSAEDEEKIADLLGWNDEQSDS